MIAKSVPEDTRSRILAATREIYSQKGYRGTTTREVAEQAGVNEATLFRHFGNKEALIEAMFKSATEHDPEALEEFFQTVPADDMATYLRRLAVRALEGMAQKRDLILITLAEEPRDPTGFNMMWRTPSVVFEQLKLYFARAVDEGKVAGDPAILAKFFMGTLFAHIMGRCIFGTPDYEAVAEYSVDIFLNGILKKNEGT